MEKEIKNDVINEEVMIRKTLSQLSRCIEKYLEGGTTTQINGQRRVKALSEVISRAIRYHGYSDAKACARDLGFHYELFRKVVGEEHIPRDEQLIIYAEKLGLDKAQVIRLAHYWRAPAEARQYLTDFVNE